MLQPSSPFDSVLLARDAHGHYVPASADQILDAARRVIDQKMLRGTSCEQPALTQEFLRAKLGGFDREVFSVLFLDAHLRLIEYVEMFHGTVNSTSVHPREIVKAALRCNAASAVMAHNHPSGIAEPSQADVLLTQTLKSALALIDVRVLDHVVVAGSATVSFAQRGLL
jgi:DNA repair protein RadC